MSKESDPDYDPSESEGSNDNDDEIFLESNKNTKRSRILFDSDEDSYTFLESIKKNAKLGQKRNSRNFSLTPKQKIKKNNIIRNQNIAHVYECNFCYYQTPFRSSFKRHFKKCNKSNAKKFWECPQCENKYKLEDLLDEHSNYVDQEDEDNIFYCPSCSFDDDGMQEVAILEKIHPNSNISQPCPRCDVEVRGLRSLIQHLISDHDVTVQYRCEYCDYFSLDSENLLKHKKIHKDLQEMGLIQCSHCRLEFFSMNDIKEHMKIVQREKKIKESEQIEVKKNIDVQEIDVNEESAKLGKWQLECTLCGYVNYSRISCQRHAKNKHRPFGFTVVTFHKYCGEQLRGSIDFGDVNDDTDDDKQETAETPPKILDWTQSDDEDIIEKNATSNEGNEEIITIELALDSEDESNKDEISMDNEYKLDDTQREKEYENNSKLDNEPSNNEYDSSEDKDVFRCDDCTYKTRHKSHFLMHDQLYHKIANKNYVFKCTIEHCNRNSKIRKRFARHLLKRHKLDPKIFYPKELKCPDCMYTAKEPHHLMMHRRSGHKNLPRSLWNSAPKVKKKSNSPRVFICSICDFRSMHHSSFWRHKKKFSHDETIISEELRARLKNSNLFSCKHCGQRYKGKYQIAWHEFATHRDRSELIKWRLKCKLCSYSSYSKLACYKHGRHHKSRRVTFQKLNTGRFKGSVVFQYRVAKPRNAKSLPPSLQHNVKEEKSIELKEEEIDNEEVLTEEIQDQDYVKTAKEATDSHDAPHTSIQILGWTHSDDENKVEKDRKSERNVSSDNEIVENKELKSDDEFDDSKELKSEDDLLVKKAEFYTCSKCNYETKTQWHLQLHETLAHGAIVSTGGAKYQCRDCEFVSKYRFSLKRHLIRFHGFNVDEFCVIHHAENIAEVKNEGDVTTRWTNKYEMATQNKNNTANDDKNNVEEEIYDCQDCHISSLTCQDKYQFDWHRYNMHGDKLGLLKWSIKCTLCDYESYSRKNAREHGRQHRGLKETLVQFDKYFDGKFKGSFSFKYEKETVHYCNECDYKTISWDCFRKHRRRNHKNSEITKIEETAFEVDVENTTKPEVDSPDEIKPNKRLRKEVAADTDEEANQSHESDDEYDKIIDINLVTNKCIHPGCKYRTQNKGHLKRHCINIHKYNREKLDPVFCEIKRYKCPSCDFQSVYRSQMKTHLIQECKGCQVCPKCNTEHKDRYQLACHMFKAHGKKTELRKWSIRCTLCKYRTFLTINANTHAQTRHSSITIPTTVKFQKFYDNKFESSFKCHCSMRKLQRCNKCSYVTDTWEGLQTHVARHNADFILGHEFNQETIVDENWPDEIKQEGDSAIDETNSRTDSATGLYTKDQIFDIIGCNSVESKEILEDDSISEIKESKEVITIEITSDEELDPENKNDKETTKLNPFTGELILIENEDREQSLNLREIENNEKMSDDFRTTKSFKCSKPGCKYSSSTLKEVTDHIKLCGQNSSQHFRNSTKFTCSLCKKVFTFILGDTLQNHTNTHASALSKPNLVVSFSQISNNRHICDIEITAQQNSINKVKENATNSKKISFKCWMCGVFIVTRKTLQNHTNLHAREDANPKLKVRYSKFRNDQLESTIVMQGDPNYVFRKKIKQRERSPELEYDPDLPVFSCDECNFKTNQEEALIKHKNLHWTSEKDASFKAGKWFTCSVCFFHCFDVETFKKHGDWHKTHSTSTGSIKKLGKNSWFLK